MATTEVSYPDEVKEKDGSVKDVESTGSYVDKAFERRTTYVPAGVFIVARTVISPWTSGVASICASFPS
jgi:hypothetical protein